MTTTATTELDLGGAFAALATAFAAYAEQGMDASEAARAIADVLADA